MFAAFPVPPFPLVVVIMGQFSHLSRLAAVLDFARPNSASIRPEPQCPQLSAPL